MQLPSFSIYFESLIGSCKNLTPWITHTAIGLFGAKKESLSSSMEIHQAAAANDLKKLKIILSLSNPSFDLPDEKGDTPLFFAARQGHLEIASFLIAQKIDINHSNIFGKTALFSAVESGHLEMIDLLIKHGSTMDKVDENEQSILHTAIIAEQNASIVFLLEYPNIPINNPDKFGQTPVILACDKQLTNSAKIMVSKGANINYSDNDGWTALMYCAKRGNIELLVNLIASNADIHAHDKEFQQTPYLIACRNGHVKLMEALCKNGANILDKDYYDRTALHIAVEINDLEMVQYALSTGIDIKSKDRFGLTALDWAIVNASADVLKAIRDHKTAE